MNRVLYQSNKDDWETPQELFNKLNKEFNFTIDVASSNTKKWFGVIRHMAEILENG